MRTALSQEQIAEYRANGFIVLSDFLTADELQEWRDALDEALATRENLRIPGRPDAPRDGYYSQVFKQRVNLWQTCAHMRKLMVDERLGKLAADLEGVDGTRIWHDQTLIKLPWANPTSWHLDNPYWSFSSRHSTSIWVALDDVTLENGCLFFLPGTHRTARFEAPSIGMNMGELFDMYPEWRTIRPVAAPMQAGSCSFHNGLTAHAAHANMTPGLRRAMTCGYMPDGSTFNGKQNILTKEQIARLKVGDPLHDDRQNPLLYSRKKASAVAAGAA